MSRIRVDTLHKKWMKDSKYRREYEALEEEFSLVAALIEARTRAGLTQEQVAQRMKTTQAVIARLEGGGSRPSTRTLERYAEATGSRLRITFEPEGPRQANLRPELLMHAGSVSPDAACAGNDLRNGNSINVPLYGEFRIHVDRRVGAGNRERLR
jgi:transcriptional regulator with XRE-family HTH domain